MSTPKGYSSQEKDDRLSAQFSTVEPVRTLQNGLSVVAHEFVYEIAQDQAESQSSTTQIVATSHAAKTGDVIRFLNGTCAGIEAKVWEVSINTITLAETLPDAPGASDDFTVLRHRYPVVDASGAVNITGSISFAEEATVADGGALPAKVKVIGGYDGAAVQVIATDAQGNLQVDVLSAPLPTGAASETTLAAVSTKLTDGTQKTQLVDAAGDIADVKQLNTTLAGTDKGLVTSTTIHGLTTGGGGGYVDVKVTPSGALVTDSTISGLDAAVLGQETMAASLPVVIASDQTAFPVTVSSIPLPTGAATETTLSAVNTKLPANLTVSSTRLLVDGSGVTQPVSAASLPLPTGAASETTLSALNTKIPASLTVSSTRLLVDGSGVTQPVSAASLPLPAGAATETTLSAVRTAVELLDNAVSGNELQVDVVAPLPAGTNTIGRVDVNTQSVVDLLDAGILDTSATNIAGSASNPTQVVSSLAAQVRRMQILDTTGAFIGLFTGAALSEVLQLVIGPGSDQTIDHSIAAGTRISLRRLDGTAAINSGIVAINFLG